MLTLRSSASACANRLSASCRAQRQDQHTPMSQTAKLLKVSVTDTASCHMFAYCVVCRVI